MTQGSPPDFFKLGLKRSAILHGSIVALILLGGVVSHFMPASSEESEALKRMKAMEGKNAIRVDMVDLPRLKLTEMQNIDLSKEIGKPKEEIPAPPTPEAKETPKEEPAPPKPVIKPSEMKLKGPDKKTDPASTAKSESRTDARNDARSRIKELQARLRADAKRSALMKGLKGTSSKDTRQALAGNQLSEGYSLTGDVAKEADIYTGKAHAHLLQYWNVPPWMNASNLSARVVVRIGADGHVIKKEFSKRSGNADFDHYVESAIAKADPFPPPPEAIRRNAMNDGIEWGFPK